MLVSWFVLEGRGDAAKVSRRLDSIIRRDSPLQIRCVSLKTKKLVFDRRSLIWFWVFGFFSFFFLIDWMEWGRGKKGCGAGTFEAIQHTSFRLISSLTIHTIIVSDHTERTIAFDKTLPKEMIMPNMY